MQIGSLFTLRRAFVMGAVAILTVLVASLAPAQAKQIPPDGGIDSPVGQEWFHSTLDRAEPPSGSDELTDGWLHSAPVIRESTSYAVTDGWLHSAIAESARNTGPRTPVASTSRGFPTEIAIASSIFTLMLAAGGVMLLRRRHTSIAA